MQSSGRRKRPPPKAVAHKRPRVLVQTQLDPGRRRVQPIQDATAGCVDSGEAVAVLACLPVELWCHMFNGRDIRGHPLMDPRWRALIALVCRTFEACVSSVSRAQQAALLCHRPHTADPLKWIRGRTLCASAITCACTLAGSEPKIDSWAVRWRPLCLDALRNGSASRGHTDDHTLLALAAALLVSRHPDAWDFVMRTWFPTGPARIRQHGRMWHTLPCIYKGITDQSASSSEDVHMTACGRGESCVWSGAMVGAALLRTAARVGRTDVFQRLVNEWGTAIRASAYRGRAFGWCQECTASGVACSRCSRALEMQCLGALVEATRAGNVDLVMWFVRNAERVAYLDFAGTWACAFKHCVHAPGDSAMDIAMDLALVYEPYMHLASSEPSAALPVPLEPQNAERALACLKESPPLQNATRPSWDRYTARPVSDSVWRDKGISWCRRAIKADRPNLYAMLAGRWDFPPCGRSHVASGGGSDAFVRGTLACAIAANARCSLCWIFGDWGFAPHGGKLAWERIVDACHNMRLATTVWDGIMWVSRHIGIERPLTSTQPIDAWDVTVGLTSDQMVALVALYHFPEGPAGATRSWVVKRVRSLLCGIIALRNWHMLDLLVLALDRMTLAHPWMTCPKDDPNDDGANTIDLWGMAAAHYRSCHAERSSSLWGNQDTHIVTSIVDGLCIMGVRTGSIAPDQLAECTNGGKTNGGAIATFVAKHPVAHGHPMDDQQVHVLGADGLPHRGQDTVLDGRGNGWCRWCRPRALPLQTVSARQALTLDAMLVPPSQAVLVRAGLFTSAPPV